MGTLFDTPSKVLLGPAAEDRLAQLEVPKTSLALALLMISTIGLVSRCLYNLYLHPLRKIPGPKLAAMTSWTDFYYDVVKDGSYLFEIGKMHEQYGPIVRITPDEVHINDPEFYSTVYSGGKSKVNKDPSMATAFGHPDATGSTVDHDQHRVRRGYFSRHYSKRAVDTLTPLINERVDALCARLEGTLKMGSRVSLDRLFAALAADVIYAQFFGAHLDYLSDPDLCVPWLDVFVILSAAFHILRLIATPLRILQRLGPRAFKLLMRLHGGRLVAKLFDLQEQTRQTVQRLLDEKNSDSPEAQCVIVQALGNPDIPPQERTIDRFVDEGIIFGLAGTETLSRTLAVGSFYLVRDKSVLARLRGELAAASEKSPGKDLTLNELEQLPYLTGVVKESIRLAFGPVCRFPRLHTEETLVYKEHAIPAGYAVSMSTWFLNLHPKTFPDPWEFRPERWIEAAQRGFPLANYLGSFSRGTRACLGQNLAYAEAFTALARVHARFDLELVDTTSRDVAIEKVYITGHPMNGRGEVMAKVTHKLED